MTNLNFFKSIIAAAGLIFSGAAAAQDMQLVFVEEFDGDTLDPSVWKITEGNGCPDLCGFGNNEKQTYTSSPQNIKLEDGKLVITALKNDDDYTSAKITTEPRDGWTYGVFSIRAKLPEGRGTWPAIWMMPKENKYGKWPKSGEIDIMEHVGFDEDVLHGTIHTESFNHIYGNQRSRTIEVDGVTEEFKTYTIMWEENRMVWFVDNQPYAQVLKEEGHTWKEWPFDHPFYLILNLTIGGDWGAQKGISKKIFPATMEVDWVKIWQKK